MATADHVPHSSVEESAESRSSRALVRATEEETGERMSVDYDVVLRSPLLSLAEWRRAISVPSDVDPTAPNSQGLADLLASSALAGALLPARALDRVVRRWLRSPSDASDHDLRTVLRGLSRMATRTTPYGGFAAVAAGQVGASTTITFVERDRYEFCLTLDAAVLRDVVAFAFPNAQWMVNPTAFNLNGRVRFIATDDRGLSEYATVDVTDALTDLLDILRPREPRSAIEVCDELVRRGTLSSSDAEGLVAESIAAGLIVPLSPPTIFQDSIAWLAEALRAANADVPDWLELLPLQRRLVDPDLQLVAGRVTAALDEVVDVDRELFHGVLVKETVRASVDRTMLAEAFEAAAIASDIVGAAIPFGNLRGLVDIARERFPSGFVSLPEFVDRECGLGAEITNHLVAQTSEPAPLPDSTARTLFLHSARRAIDARDGEINLHPADFASIPSQVDRGAIGEVSLTLFRTEAGEERALLLDWGPNVGRFDSRLGRFASASPQIYRMIAERQEGSEPTPFDVPYRPFGREANITARPDWGQPQLLYGGSSAGGGSVLDPCQVSVIIDGLRFRLWSHQLCREVVPRILTAHNFSNMAADPLILFVAALQYASGYAGGWRWEGLAEAPRLPRVRYKRILLSPRRWRLDLAPGPSAERARAFRSSFDREHERPDLVSVRSLLSADTSAVVVDPTSEASASCAFTSSDQAMSYIVEEVLPPGASPAGVGPEGAFLTEALVARRPRYHPTTEPRVLAAVDQHGRDHDSDWLSVKLYRSERAATRVIRESIGPLIPTCSRLALPWFFMNYGDPLPHVRVRIKAPAELRDRIRTMLSDCCEPLVDAGVIWKIDWSPYQPELFRYGGSDAMSAAEAVFCSDSSLVAALRLAMRSDQTTVPPLITSFSLRWVDNLLDALGLGELETKLGISAACASGLRTQLPTRTVAAVGHMLRVRGATTPRRARDLPPDVASPLASAGQSYRRLASQNKLTRPLHSVVPEFVHMHVNRLASSSQMADEYRTWEALWRWYQREVALAGSRA